MNFIGTTGNDVIDQAKLGLTDWSTIYGNEGDDTITIGIGIVNGGIGQDTLIGTSRYSTASYGDSPKGIVVNLVTGFVQDGFGTVDRLTNIRIVQGNGFNDSFIGSAENEVFWGNGGNDTFAGGGGYDEVIFWMVKYSESTVKYNASTDSWVIVFKNSSNATYTANLTGIHQLTFSGLDYKYNVTKYDMGVFNKTPVTNIAKTLNAFISSSKIGDFNGDGISDIVIGQQIGTGKAATQDLIYLGDGKGGFTNGTTFVFGDAAGIANAGGGRTLVADFNKDGKSDIFQLVFGDDAPPFPGGLNKLYLSSSITGKIENASSSLNQTTQLNHGGSIGDVDGDGYLDILVNSLRDGNFLLMNDGTGHFIDRTDMLPRAIIPNTTITKTNTYSGIVDINGDSRGDIILGRWDSTGPLASQVLLNDGTGNFTKLAPIDLPTSGVFKEIVLDVKAIDLNGDLLPDLMISTTSGGVADPVTGLASGSPSYYTTPYIQLLVNDGNGHFHDETTTRLPQMLVGNSGWYSSIENIDFNHDGHPDILATAAVGNTNSSKVFINNGDGKFDKVWESASGEIGIAADINNDGSTDLLTFTDASGNNPSLSASQNKLSNSHIYIANWGGEKLLGSAANDTFRTRDGYNTLDGGLGIDKVIYSKLFSQYRATHSSDGTWSISTSTANVDTLKNIERLQFSDKTIALDIDGNAGQTYRIYKAAFNRTPDNGGLKYWIGMMDGGTNLPSVASGFIASNEFKALYGANPSNDQFVNKLYSNVLGRAPDAGGFNYWVGLLNNKQIDMTSTLVNFFESPENQAGVIGVIQNGIDLLN